ncbi:CapA family protein [Streptomyces sioyaensis]|uniref:CapA family protein n=1 Tax=Streptomyces sioyaensis TaxID=67364 RepID=A0A4Q1R2J6_9ACTN|nr:CapA family protein [Streptomyces sioyaensis]MBM4792432.1 CapA family protein [Streptomyces sioyaensis]RXS67214.1 CapA family protein [Streptomyces sioyaensis]
MSAYTRSAAVAALVALAAGCAGPPPVPHSVPRPAPRPTPEPSPRAHAGAPVLAGRRPFTLVAAGAVLPSQPEVLTTARSDAAYDGYDYRPMLRGVRPVISSADLALCQLGAPLGPLSGPFAGYPVLQAPPQIATALKATGYDSCATASRHALDHGVPGVRRTLEALDTVGLRHAGSARDAAERGSPALLRVPGGARVAQLSYTDGAGGARRPASAPWAVEPLDERRIIGDARAARRAGADVVVVSPYWGAAHRTAPDGRQLALARALTASTTHGRPDIDLIVGTRAHTPQPYEKVHGTWVVYGLGDQITGAPKRPRGTLSSIARFRFAPPHRAGGRWRVVRAEYVPQLAEQGARVRVRNLARTSGHGQARKKIAKAVLSRGAAADGLRSGS